MATDWPFHLWRPLRCVASQKAPDKSELLSSQWLLQLSRLYLGYLVPSLSSKYLKTENAHLLAHTWSQPGLTLLPSLCLEKALLWSVFHLSKCGSSFFFFFSSSCCSYYLYCCHYYCWKIWIPSRGPLWPISYIQLSWISYYKINASTVEVTFIFNEAICTLDKKKKMYAWCYHGENRRDFRLIVKKA